jgi:aerobic carbon-monoxide dehydrogenase medium subunit
MIKDFEYFGPKTLKEALDLLDKYQDDYKVIGGGQSLLIIMRQGLVTPANLIDIYGIDELRYIKSDGKKGLKIGALTTHRTVERSELLTGSFYGVLSEMEHRLSSPQTRNRGTIGGNIAHGDPAGDPAPVLIAMGAMVKMASVHGERTEPIEDFCIDYYDTDIKHGELLVEIQLPAPPPHTGAAYTKFNIIDSDMATVSVGASVTLAADDTCTNVRIALGAAAPKPMRALKAEAVLKGKKLSDTLLKKAGDVAAEEASPVSDISASEEYRRELVRVLTRRVTKEAASRAKAG